MTACEDMAEYDAPSVSHLGQKGGGHLGMTASDCLYINAGASLLQSFPNKRLALTFAVQFHSLNSDLNTPKA